MGPGGFEPPFPGISEVRSCYYDFPSLTNFLAEAEHSIQVKL